MLKCLVNRILFSVIFLMSGLFVDRIEGVEENDPVLLDWKRQEEDAGRAGFSPEAVSVLLDRARATLEWSEEQDWIADEQRNSLEQKIQEAEKDTNPETAYRNLRSCLRDMVLANPGVKDQPILFMKSERFTWQMLHEFMSYYYHATGMHGGGVYLLSEPGQSFKTESLTAGQFPKGVFETLSLSWDGQSVYFSFADLSKVQASDQKKTGAGELMSRPYFATFETEYMKQTDGKFHIYKMNLADRSMEQLTDGPDDDFDPVELPDGDLVFVSTRRGGFGRCHGHWEPLRVHTLHRWNKDDGSVQCLSWHETNEWQPTILHDGRILYTRWDYVDRSASRHHGLWVTNPDGTASTILFGNYTYDLNACYQAKAIPDSKKIIFIGGAHHLDIGGPLCMLDPSRIRYNPETAEDDLSSIENLTPEIDLPEVASDLKRGCNQYYHSPWPLSEDVWLVAYSHDPLGGYLTGTEKCGKTGLYYRDRLGNLELLYQDEGEESCLYPIPVAARETPPVIPSSLPEKVEDKTGTFVLSNVYESLVPFPSDRKIKELRIFQLLPKGPDYRGHVPPVGHPFAGNARLLLGTVPVEEDGSAHFRAPACVPVYFQAVDETGRAVQSMRSIVYLQPGESRGCIGCHEQAFSVQANLEKRSLASVRAPSELSPGPDFNNPFSYPLFVQPIWDRNCINCHTGKDGGVLPSLVGIPEPPFSQSYNQLKPYLRWYEWLPDVTYRNISTLPGECGSDICPLTKILEDENHKNVILSDKDRRDLYLWLDSNIPFYGVYEAGEQAKQLRGEEVPAPALQ